MSKADLNELERIPLPFRRRKVEVNESTDNLEEVVEGRNKVYVDPSLLYQPEVTAPAPKPEPGVGSLAVEDASNNLSDAQKLVQAALQEPNRDN